MGRQKADKNKYNEIFITQFFLLSTVPVVENESKIFEESSSTSVNTALTVTHWLFQQIILTSVFVLDRFYWN